jgi:energy-coupling factor transporter ATP-binding protein EcfA2
MLKSVRIKNFRAITDLNVDGLSRVNLFVGHNACGKTTLLEGLFFLVGATNPKLPVSVNTFRGFPYINRAVWLTYFHNMNVRIPIEICAEDADTREEQCLMIRPRYEKPRIDRPVFPSMPPSDLVAASSQGEVTVNGLELEYATSADPSRKEQSSVFVREDRLVDEGTRARLPTGTFVIPLPADLRDRFSEVQRKKRVPEVVSLLKEVEPGIEDLRLLDPPGLLYADAGAVELIPVNLMGGGIMKLLSTALAMLNMQDGFVLIDEIENGLDYSSQRKLWDAIFSWAQKLNVQVFASTHSMECIKAFSECAEAELFGGDGKMFRVERKEDKFRAVEYTRELLAESLDSNWEVR